MAKDFSTMEDSNRSSNPSIHEVSDPARRTLLRGGLAGTVTGLLAPLSGVAALAGCATAGGGAPLLGFKSVPVSTADTVVVPEGYSAQVIAAWGEPAGLSGEDAAFKFDGSNSAAEQETQIGMHHDGIHFFKHPITPESSSTGLLAMNHEYADDGLLHTDGMATWNAGKVRKAQAAHGVSVLEVEAKDGKWSVVRPSPWARRITASTPMAFGGPAAGHPLVQTRADPRGVRPLGTLNNCGSGITPWGTYLTCEENFIFYFNGGDTPSAHERRWGLRKGGVGYRWHEHDERFDATKHPNEPNRFGWIVEIDPYNPSSTPIKRTAMGRAAHEGATTTLTKDGRAVVYMGEDARFEYIYKFVSRDKVKPGGFAANSTLLDHGSLWVAKFDDNGKGRWIELKHGSGPLNAAAGFADQGEVVIKARQAADLLGGTKMDRPEWLAIDERSRWIYCTLTNNSARGAEGQPGVDAANPRANNSMGHIIRWKEDGDFDGAAFDWNHLVLAGDPANERPEARGNIRGDLYACPDGIAFDARGVLWIQTDMSTSQMHKGDLSRVGNNQMLACNPVSGEVRRFFTGPTGCEVTGVTWTPDGRTMFLNIQHPGESPSERSNPAEPNRFSNWPDFQPGGRPRSATVVVRRVDGGVIGT